MADNGIVIRNPLGKTVTYGMYDNIRVNTTNGTPLYYSKLPEVTTEHNGKVLGVIDGVWNIAEGGGQVDWTQNDDTAIDYIKNKPFYEEPVFEEFNAITDAENAVVFETEMGIFTKISSWTPSLEEYLNTTITLRSEANNVNWTYQPFKENVEIIAENAFFDHYDGILICDTDNLNLEMISAIVPEAGFYVLDMVNDTPDIYISLSSTTVKQIDNKFLSLVHDKITRSEACPITPFENFSWNGTNYISNNNTTNLDDTNISILNEFTYADVQCSEVIDTNQILVSYTNLLPQDINIDGVEYRGIGNLSAYGGTGSEPFGILFNLETQLFTLIDYTYTTESENPPKFSFGIVLIKDEGKKIKNEYLDFEIPEQAQVDWEQVDETAVDFIKNKPFIFDYTIADLRPMKSIVTTAIHPTFNLYFTQEDDPSYTLEVGETYMVEWDEVLYKCVGIDVSDVFGIPDSVAIGNGSAAGYPSNNEPFIIGKFESNSKAYIAITDTEIGVEHTVRIYKPDDLSSYKIKEEHLPILNNTPLINELRPKKTFTGFTLDPTWGLYQVTEEDASYTLEVGETYTVEWDGHIYECIGQDVSAMFGVTGSVAIGNGTLVGLPSNNEPFIIGKFNGDWKGYISTTDTTGDRSHTVRIYQLNENSGYKLKEEYMPEFTRKTLLREQPIPCFYFVQDTYIGFGPLASFEFIAGETYIVMFDGVEYKLKAFTNDNGYLMIGSETFDASAPFAISLNDNGYVTCIVKDASEYHTIGIYQRVRLLGGSSDGSQNALPAVTSADEGKFLRVVNGAWAAIALPNAEEASF